MTNRLLIYRPARFPRPVLRRPLFSMMVNAGFPSPADDHQERTIDLNEEIVRNEAATFYYRLIGHSGHSEHCGHNGFARDGDIAAVDCSLTPHHGDLVIAIVDGERCCKRLCMVGKRVWLESANQEYPDIDITGECTLIVEGVVTHTIHAHRRNH